MPVRLFMKSASCHTPQAATAAQKNARGAICAPDSGTAMSWDSMKGRFRSHSCGGNGPQSGLLLSRTPVYMMVGVPSESAMQHPAHMQAPLMHAYQGHGVKEVTYSDWLCMWEGAETGTAGHELLHGRAVRTLTGETPVCIKAARCWHESRR